MITGIGSFPFTSIDETIDFIFSTSPEIPFWPQLPKRAPSENMYTPFLAPVPCVVSSPEKDTAFIDTTKTEGIESFYDHFFNDDIDSFAIPEEDIPGFYRFLDRVNEVSGKARFIKGQLTGPFSMGLGLKDEEGKPIIYNPSFYDIIKKALHMEARWMVRMIRSRYPEKEVIIFFDEPYLVSFGSAYVSISKDETIGLINEVITGVDAKRGIHCCGNTDWSILFNTEIDLVNYDAWSFFDTIFYYHDDLIRFLNRGGRVAPGIVPSSEEVLGAKPEDLRKILASFQEKMASLAQVSADDVFVTTSCGLGSLKPDEARRAMELLKTLG